jgi:peptidoglycan/xylan/chitin deacetylase (PgdA/CDA1 family)
MQKSYFGVTITIGILLFAIILYPLSPNISYSQQQQQLFPFLPPTNTIKDQINNDIQNESITHASGGNSSSSSNTPKVVILDFYDNDIGQFTNAKPILNKYGFKGTFFIVCKWATSDNPVRMNWQEINQLYREGHDIESHTMTHKPLDALSTSALDYQVGQSKQCIHDHLGIYPTVLSPPHSRGSNNATVIDTIAKYYDLSIGGFVNDVMFLHCYGWQQHQHKQQQQYLNQRDCRPYSDNGMLNYASRYDIKENAGAEGHSNDTLIFNRFANLVNREGILNSNNNNIAMPINSVLILGYHNIDNNQTASKDTTDIALFDKEMKYLHNNSVKVITMSDLGYDENSKYLYVRNNT